MDENKWEVIFHPDFDRELYALPRAVSDELLALAVVLAQVGPMLGRPNVDTLKGSRYANMKEGRFIAEGGVWRVAFAFDPQRRAVVLVAGDKAGIASRLFYKRLIRTADARYADHLQDMEGHPDG